MSNYNPHEIEKKWQAIWDKNSGDIAVDFSDKPKHYHLIEFPYPSGSGLHVGHCMGYTASDVYSRMMRMRGYNVLFPIGWDAFGLPTENHALKTGKKPAVVTKENTDIFRKQMKSLAYSFDWDREVNTTDPNYYRWTQWIFLQFYKHGIVDGKLVKVSDDDQSTPRLAYQAEMAINWCPSCKIGLANEEVIDGKCERCGSETYKKMQKQWMLRITAYADKLIDGLKETDYLEKIKTQQINWIGKSTGINILFKIKGQDKNIEVFTTRADTLFGCTYVVLSPELALVGELKANVLNLKDVEKYIDEARKKSDLERTELQKEKTGVKLEGITAINPVNNEEVDVWVADYVLSGYGTGAVMAVPAHDERDFVFAKKHGIRIKKVIASKEKSDTVVADREEGEKCFTEYGVMENSGEFNGLTSIEGKQKIAEKLKVIGAGDFSINYKLRDWVFSRQHYWGEPIPIIHCEKCGIVPMSEKDLPLTLPDVEKYEPTDTGESPLAAIANWVEVKCPKCYGNARRETDTMPNWAGSSWYYLAYAVHKNLMLNTKYQENESVFDKSKKELEYWLPVDIYNGGMEHVTLHLLYSRFWHKFLYDLGEVPTIEPYQKRIAHGIILGTDGQKMSKSKGNVVNPDEIVEKYGADTMRAYIMFIGPYDQESAWSITGLQGVFRFLHRVWNNYPKVSEQVKDSGEILGKINKYINAVTDDIENFRLNTYMAKLMEINNEIDKVLGISRATFESYLQLLAPAVPHLSEELWAKLGNNDSILSREWPKVDERYLVDEFANVAVQINGKLRGVVNVATESSQNDVQEALQKDPAISKWIEQKEIIKVIYRPGKIISLVTK